MSDPDSPTTCDIPTTVDELCEVLVRRSPALIAYLEKRIPPIYKGQIVAEEVFQEVCTRAVEALRKFRNDGDDALDRWLTTIADRVILNRIRDAGRQKRGGGKPALRNGDKWKTSAIDLLDRVRSPVKTPCREAQRAEAVNRVLVNLSRLRQDYRDAVKLHYLDGLSVEQIAAKMDRSESAVNSMLYRGMTELRRLMGNRSDFLSDDGAANSNGNGKQRPD